MGKAEENKKKKRNALLTHAFSLFMNKGITNTTISDIAQKAGVGKGTFYFYFKDKEDLVEKLIADKASELLNNSIHKLTTTGLTLSAEDKLVFIADDLLDQLNENVNLLKFINKNLNYALLHQAFSRDDIKSEMDIHLLFTTLIESDGSKWKDPDIMLYTIIELVSSTCHSIILKGEPVSLDEYKPYLFECIRNISKIFKLPDKS